MEERVAELEGLRTGPAVCITERSVTLYITNTLLAVS